MHVSKFVLVSCGLMGAIAPAWAADQEWAKESRAQRSFTTAIYNSEPSRLIVECRESSYLAPELSLTVVPSSDNKTIVIRRGKGTPLAG